MGLNFTNSDSEIVPSNVKFNPNERIKSPISREFFYDNKLLGGHELLFLIYRFKNSVTMKRKKLLRTIRNKKKNNNNNGKTNILNLNRIKKKLIIESVKDLRLLTITFQLINNS